MRVQKFLGVAVSSVVLGLASGGVALTMAPGDAAAEVRGELREADIMLVKMHADWCGNCKALNPHWDSAQNDRLGKQNVLFVKFDITNQQTRAHSEMLANELGLGDVWEARSGSTGQMFIVDRSTKKVIADFNSRSSAKSIAKAIDDALKS